MNGFYITISNGLIEGAGHRNRMGSAVWEFMWCIDRVTKIDSKGMGWVLGGKPINLKDIDLGHANTISRNLNKLQAEGYIEIRRTPRGMVIKVCKAKKIFKQTNKRSTKGKKSDSQKQVNHKDKGITKTSESITKNGESVTENGDSNIRQDIDKTDDKTQVLTHELSGGEVNELMEEFRSVNPTIDALFKNKTERSAIQQVYKTLSKKYEDPLACRKALKEIIKSLEWSNDQEFAPRINSPHELLRKFGKLMSFHRDQAKKKNGAGNVAFTS